MKIKAVYLIVAAGIIIVSFTFLLAFALANGRVAAQWASFIFIVTSEAIAVGGSVAILAFLKKPRRALSITEVSLLIWIYTLISMIAPLMFAIGLINSIIEILFTQLIAFAIVGVAAALIFLPWG